VARQGSIAVCLAVAAHLTAQTPAAAASRSAALTIEVEPNACFSSEALARKTAAVLQREEVDARLSTTVSMRGADAFFQLSRGGTTLGERLVTRRNLTCDQFVSVLATALAVAIDTALLDVEGEETPLESDPSPSPPSEASPPPSPSEAPPPLPPSKELPRPAREADAVQRSREDEAKQAWRFALTFEATALAALHEPTLGNTLGLVFVRPSIGRLGVSSFVTLPVDTDLRGESARVGLFAGRVDACLAPPLRNIPLAPCAAAVVGAHRAEGVVASRAASSDWALWSALALGPELTVAFGRWSLVARVEPWWVIRPSRLVTARTDGELSKTGPNFGAAAFLGIRWTIL
jgi:hypothetical protein